MLRDELIGIRRMKIAQLEREIKGLEYLPQEYQCVTFNITHSHGDADTETYARYETDRPTEIALLTHLADNIGWVPGQAKQDFLVDWNEMEDMAREDEELWEEILECGSIQDYLFEIEFYDFDVIYTESDHASVSITYQ